MKEGSGRRPSQENSVLMVCLLHAIEFVDDNHLTKRSRTISPFDLLGRELCSGLNKMINRQIGASSSLSISEFVKCWSCGPCPFLVLEQLREASVGLSSWVMPTFLWMVKCWGFYVAFLLPTNKDNGINNLMIISYCNRKTFAINVRRENQDFLLVCWSDRWWWWWLESKLKGRKTNFPW